MDRVPQQPAAMVRSELDQPRAAEGLEIALEQLLRRGYAMIKGNEWWFVVILAFGIAFTLGCMVATKYAHQHAIDQSCAHYNVKTGQFTWGLPQ